MGPAQVKCPSCGRLIAWTADAAHRPFCSERCRLIDLGAWLTERRALPADPAEPPGAPEQERGDPG